MTEPVNLWEGKPAADWIEMLHDPDGHIRWKAVDALRHICAPADTIPLFIPVLKDEYWRSRSLAAHALYDMAFEEQYHELLGQAIDPLVEMLKNETRDDRFNAIYTLELLGPDAARAIPALMKLIETEDDELREAAEAAIREIQSGEKRLVIRKEPS